MFYVKDEIEKVSNIQRTFDIISNKLWIRTILKKIFVITAADWIFNNYFLYSSCLKIFDILSFYHNNILYRYMRNNSKKTSNFEISFIYLWQFECK